MGDAQKQARPGTIFVKWPEASDDDICRLNQHMRKLINDLNTLLDKPHLLSFLAVTLEQALDEVQRELRKRSGQHERWTP